MNLKDHIRTVQDWPKKGIQFRDITTLLKDPVAFKQVIDSLTNRYSSRKIDLVAGIESRGFIIGAALAHRLGVGFVPIRKKGKLPAKTRSMTYTLEYGTDTLEVHEDAIVPGAQVLLVDDLLATGGTASAACSLISQARGTIVECCFVINLPDLKGEDALKQRGYTVFSLVEFEGD